MDLHGNRFPSLNDLLTVTLGLLACLLIFLMAPSPAAAQNLGDPEDIAADAVDSDNGQGVTASEQEQEAIEASEERAESEEEASTSQDSSDSQPPPKPSPPGSETDRGAPPAENQASASRPATDQSDQKTHLLGMSFMKTGDDHVVVTDVEPLGPAWDAGIRAKDRLRSVEGVPVSPYEPFVEAVKKLVIQKKEGEHIAMNLLRGDEKISLQVTERDAEKTDIPTDEERELEDLQHERQKDMVLSGGGGASRGPGSQGPGGEGLGSEQGAAGPATGPQRGGAAGYTEYDQDYYYGGYGAPGFNQNQAGFFGSGQDSFDDSQRRQLERLNRMRYEQGLTSSQEDRYFDLLSRYSGASSDAQPLDDRERATLQNLREQEMAGRDLSSEQRQQLQDLQSRADNSMFSDEAAVSLAERDFLEDLSARGDLSRAQSDQLNRLRQLDQRFDASSGPSSAPAGFSNSLDADQQRRYEELTQAARRGDLTAAEQRELQSFQRWSGYLSDRQMRNQYMSLQQQLRTGQGLSPQQRTRMNALRQDLSQRMNQFGQTFNSVSGQRRAQQRAMQPLTNTPGTPNSAGLNTGSGSGIGLPAGTPGSGGNTGGGNTGGGNAGGGGGNTGGGGQN